MKLCSLGISRCAEGICLEFFLKMRCAFTPWYFLTSFYFALLLLVVRNTAHVYTSFRYLPQWKPFRTLSFQCWQCVCKVATDTCPGLNSRVLVWAHCKLIFSKEPRLYLRKYAHILRTCTYMCLNIQNIPFMGGFILLKICFLIFSPFPFHASSLLLVMLVKRDF